MAKIIGHQQRIRELTAAVGAEPPEVYTGNIEGLFMLYRAYKFCYHAIIASPFRQEYLCSMEDVKVTVHMACSAMDGSHPHRHFLCFTNASGNAMKKRFQKVADPAEPKNNYLKIVRCEKHLQGCLHYFHCERAQKLDHKHNLQDGCFLPRLLHYPEDCNFIKNDLSSIVIIHPEDCRCTQDKERYFKNIREAKKRKAEAKPDVKFEPITKDNVNKGPFAMFKVNGGFMPPPIVTRTNPSNMSLAQLKEYVAKLEAQAKANNSDSDVEGLVD